MSSLKKLTLATLSAALTWSASVHAQEVPPESGVSTAEGAETGAFYVPYGNLTNAKPEDVERAKQVGASVANDLMRAYEKRQENPDLANAMQRVKKRADDIADASMAADRDKVMEFLGIDPQSQNGLYYFVSWSMPLEMLRSYAIEAMWSGGTLVFKGMPAGRDLGAYLSEDLPKLTYGKGASANISIDPRMFDAYQVETVPTIAFTTYRADMQCVGVNPVSFTYRDQPLSYDTCPPLDASKYAKVSGAVTTNYALQSFIDEGWTGAKPYLDALARGFALGKVPEKIQQPFSGKWEDVVSPSERMAAQEAARMAMTAPSTPASSASPSSEK